MNDQIVDALASALPGSAGLAYWSAREIAQFQAEELHQSGWWLVLLPQTPWAADEFRHLAERIHDLVADGTVAEVSEA